MKDLMKHWEETPYPEMIRGLPEIDIQTEGIRGWLFQSTDRQIVFFDIQPVGKIPPHSHCSQWGIVIEGEMSLTIGDKTELFRKGDWYFIPAGTEHSATFPTRVHVMDIFEAPDRYSIKK